MNLGKKKLEAFLEWVEADCLWVAEYNSGADNYRWNELRTLFRACLMLGIFKNTFADINQQNQYPSELKNNKYPGNIYALRKEIKKQIQEFLKPEAKKTLGVQDEESSEHQD